MRLPQSAFSRFRSDKKENPLSTLAFLNIAYVLVGQLDTENCQLKTSMPSIILV